LINNVGKLVRRATGENIALQFNYSPNVPVVEADSEMIEQMVVHLANNARDAMPQGGQLTIATKLTTIDESHIRQHSEAREGRFVCLTVADTGCGMDEATLERIFEPFLPPNRRQSSGLGLALVHGSPNSIRMDRSSDQGRAGHQLSNLFTGQLEGPRTAAAPENKPPVRAAQRPSCWSKMNRLCWPWRREYCSAWVIRSSRLRRAMKLRRSGSATRPELICC